LLSTHKGKAMGDRAAMIQAVEAAMKAGDLANMQELLKDYATDDFVEEWPQSGERLTREASMRMAEHYPEMSGTSPKMTYERMLGGGDVFVIEGTIDYGDGVPVSYVGIGEMRGDKVAKMTEYFANPFEAPAWRADFVERMDKATA
jgi:hypothetical protein